MTVKIHISKDIAQIAVGQAIVYDEKPTSERKFRDCISTYIWQFGESSANFHLEENITAGVDDEAKRIVDKYWR